MSVGLEDLAILILDEADRLLEFGFNGEIQELVSLQYLSLLQICSYQMACTFDWPY